MPSNFQASERLNLPGYPFAMLERQAAELRASGRPVYDLSIGDPDLPPPGFVIEAVRKGVLEPAAHRYPSSRGDRAVRQAVARWFSLRFGVELDPERQVCILIGAKEGLGQLARAVVNPGDAVGVPDPAYPVYGRAGARFVDGSLQTIPLYAEKGFLPDPEELPEVKLLFMNYPNNPTGAEANDDFLRRLGAWAEAHPSSTVAYDMAYSEVTFGRRSRSLLEFTDRCVEFHSLSKMANATGFRVGFAVGHPERIAALVRVKEEMDSGAPLPFQRALAAALDSYADGRRPAEMEAFLETYRRRRELVKGAIQASGRTVFATNATFYLWFKAGDEEERFVSRALEKGLLLTPGSGFGPAGRGWVRASVTAPDDHIARAADILAAL